MHRGDNGLRVVQDATGVLVVCYGRSLLWWKGVVCLSEVAEK